MNPFPELGTPKSGKVRDIYDLGDRLIMITSDRISCFDRILLDTIPYKGAVLNLLSQFWFQNLEEIIQNHWISCPDPQCMVVRKLTPFPFEVIVRRYLCGSLWRAYIKGARTVSGVTLPPNLSENQCLPELIITPTTKNPAGHDENIAPEELTAQRAVTAGAWEEIRFTALRLFKKGEEIAREQGLVLVDTKYEFGQDDEGALFLIDEVHTPDSSRFWYQDDLSTGLHRFSDKERVRQWLMERGFMGDGEIPRLPPSLVQEITGMYRKLFESLTGKNLPTIDGDPVARIRSNLLKAGLCISNSIIQEVTI